MAIITLLTDSGDQDHYVAAIKAKILSVNPGLRIEDISHRIQPGNLSQAAFVLQSVFRDYPDGTVHLIGVDSISSSGYLAASIDGHFLIGPDNGILSLFSERPLTAVVELNFNGTGQSTFPEKDILAPAAARLASGMGLSDLGKPVTTIRRLTQRQLKVSRQQILGFVLHVDHQGNLITNITRDAFEQTGAGRKFVVRFGKEKSDRIQSFYHQSEPGDCFVLFTSLGLLEVGINRGNASRLLGLSADSPVNVLFEE